MQIRSLRGMLAVLCLLALGAAGCSFDRQPTRDGGGTAPTATRPAAAATPQAPAPGGTPTTDSAGAPTSDGRPVADVPAGATPLSLTARHPNSVTLRLTSLAVAPESISLGIVATNGGQRDVDLDSSEDMVLVDQLGNRYTVSPPPTNAKITVRQRTTLRGTLVFIGSVDARATTLTLITNNDYGSADNEYSSSPKFTIAGIRVPR